MSTDAIVVLKEDHKNVKRLFKQFQAAQDGPSAAKAKIVTEILAELTVHTYLENEVMYPEVRRLLPDLDSDILESYEEHHVADVLCMELATMTPDEEHFDAKVTVLIESVTHHIDEEEQDWFPKVRDGLGRNQLQEIGARMQQPAPPHRPPPPSRRLCRRHSTRSAPDRGAPQPQTGFTDPRRMPPRSSATSRPLAEGVASAGTDEPVLNIRRRHAMTASEYRRHRCNVHAGVSGRRLQVMKALGPPQQHVAGRRRHEPRGVEQRCDQR